MDYTKLSLADVIAALADVPRQAEATFGGLDARRLNWKPEAARWSVAQCLEHLILTNRAMMRHAIAALTDGHPRTIWQRLPLLPSMFGPMLIRGSAPTATRRFTTTAVAQPSASDIAADVLTRFAHEHQHVLAWMRALDERRASRAIMISPFARVVAYSVLDGCRLMVAHDHRHVQQARRVTELPAFPQD